MSKQNKQNWAIPEKSKQGGLRIWIFQGLSKEHVEFPGANSKRSGISKHKQEKIMWNFQESLFLAFEFPRDLTQFCGISRD